ncbi:MAG: SCO family protein [Chloroflexi bacterium]|nr:SCO family protein [Chloroflexota bacterium]
MAEFDLGVADGGLVGFAAWRTGQTKLALFGYGAIAVIVLVVFAFAFFQPIQVLPRISIGPGFAFVDQAGQRLTNEDLRGHLVLYTFTYIGCQTPCPQTSPVFQAVQQRLAQINTRGLPVDLVTISFDPARDTPPRLAAFAQQLGADLATWHFVTGEPAALKNVIGGNLGLYYNRNADGSFVFDPAFVLIDGVGIVRAKYRMVDLDPAIVQRDLELMASEARNSQGAAHFAYEAAHLFLCYPQ